MSSQVIPSEDTEGLRLSKKRRKVKKAEASVHRNRAFSERTRKKRAHEAKLAKKDADRRSRDRELHEEKRRVISKKLQEKRDAAARAKAEMFAKLRDHLFRRASQLYAFRNCLL